MSEPFIGEIRSFGFNFPPRGWAFCAGQLLPISQNTALFSILGTTYGGDGRTTFGLPNLQGNVPIHQGAGPGLTPRSLGEMGGEEAVALNLGQMPSHSHAANCNSGAGNNYGPTNNYWAADGGGANEYSPGGGAQMAANALGSAGRSTAHNNMQPFLAVNLCIALQGIYPSRS